MAEDWLSAATLNRFSFLSVSWFWHPEGPDDLQGTD
jgi:hypothetical protein